MMNSLVPPISRPDRRQFLLAAGAATVCGLTRSGSVQAGPADEQPMPIVDTHQHLWDLSSQKLAWLEGAPDVLRKSYGLKEYAVATEGLHVSRAVYMEVDVVPEQQQAEADLLLSICRSGKGPTVAAVISGRPNSEQFAPYIRALAKHPEIRGARQVLHPETTGRGLCNEPQFVRSMKLLGELGLSFDLCMRPGELSDAVRLVKACPETRFVLDHCGNADPALFLPNPPASSEKPAHDPQQWKRDIQDLAACQNVICKISGIIASAPTGVPFADSLAPVVNHCLDAFGPDRVVFGGDWPVCLLGGSYRDWVTTLKQIIGNRPEADQRKLLSGNAMTFYRLKA